MRQLAPSILSSRRPLAALALAAALVLHAHAARAQAGADSVRRRPTQLAAVRVSPLPAWQCAPGPALARTHGTDGLVCNAHFISAAVAAAIVEGQEIGASPACARAVAANVERAVSELVMRDTAAARRAELTPCDGRSLTYDSLVVDERALLRLCPGQIWSWVSRGTVSCGALAQAAGAGAAGSLANVSAARDTRAATEAGRRASDARRLYDDEQLAKARDEARRALALDSLDAGARAVLGASLSALGHKDSAVVELRRAVAGAPGDSWAWGQLAAALYWARRDAELDTAARAALANDGANASVFWYAGQGALRRGDTAAAVTALDRAATLAPNDPRVRASRAAAYVAAGRAAEGEQEARTATVMAPRYAPGFVILGRALEALGRPREARDAYRRAHAISDWDPEPVERLKALDGAR